MNKLLPYETIVKAHEGDPDAIDTILSRVLWNSSGYIRRSGKGRCRLRPGRPHAP